MRRAFRILHSGISSAEARLTRPEGAGKRELVARDDETGFARLRLLARA
jgi:hypothetical protein